MLLQQISEQTFVFVQEDRRYLFSSSERTLQAAAVNTGHAERPRNFVLSEMIMPLPHPHF